jgi:outer membrane murein-binding lipoprotein Lpp
MLKRHWWLLVTTAIFTAGAANAESSTPDLDKVDRMQRQMEQLQEQMKQVKQDLVEAKKKAAEANAATSGFDGAYMPPIQRDPVRQLRRSPPLPQSSRCRLLLRATGATGRRSAHPIN